jgi:N-acetyl-1-D-myo-inositol-2-amino-2-deoxy-alpha-D-glucopyranoside deacetylase
VRVSPASVLAVYAHPDDELFHGGGVLAHLADRGVHVTIACATKGEAGKAHPSVGTVADLGALRADELRASCAALGITEAPRFLGFHDSARKERQRHDDPRALANVDMLEVEAAIRKVIDEVTPQVVITFDPHGGYYHPDHLAVHRATTAAFFSSSVLGAAAPARLFYSTFAIEAYREHARRIQGAGITDGLDPEVFAVRRETVAFVFDSRPYMDRKRVAFDAHRAAFGGDAHKFENFRPLFEEEVFILGGATRAPLPHWPLSGLFDGLEPSPR